MAIIVTREYLISLLQAWKEQKITACEVLSTISAVWGDMKVLDDENCDDYSVTQEVMNALESLDTDLIIEEDIEAYIEFLKTPIGKYKEGEHKFNRYISKINWEEREEKYKDIEPYSRVYGEGTPWRNHVYKKIED